jgi:hypothetical protein
MTADPDLHVCGLSIWVDGRQFPDASDYWDGNWLMVRARMEAAGARADCGGPILMATDFKQFRDELVSMVDTLVGEAVLAGLEPELKVTFKMTPRGGVEGEVEITPDHLTQRHRFTVQLDQSYLPALVASCDAVLDRFPIVSTPEV